jgi:long-chain acyl-CoA synthetase
MLRGLAGVDEALVVGEGRPFCAALLWVDDAHQNAASRTSIDDAVVRMNRDLSHPEQVKRWAALSGRVSVASGELTPNLKLRRPVVLRRFAREIDALYEEGESGTTAGVRVGSAPREGAVA